MKVNDVLRKDEAILRVLAVRDGDCLCINCNASRMPFWASVSELDTYTQEDAQTEDMALSTRQKQVAHERYTMIAPILAFLTDDAERNRVLGRVSDEYSVSKQTLRRWLCKYLAVQDISALAPAERETEQELTVALNHIGLLVVDEIQNVVNSKNGSIVVGMLTQLINNAGISICMVGTPKSSLFFGQEMMLARRSLGLSYGPFACDDIFAGFCRELFQYQYVQEGVVLDDNTLQWLYDHSHGNASIVVSLLHDAQEIAILDGSEELGIVPLEKAYKSRLTMLHDYLYQEPVQARKHPARKGKGAMAVPSGKKEENLITEVVTRAKRLQKNIVEELVYYGVNVSEVSA